MSSLPLVRVPFWTCTHLTRSLLCFKASNGMVPYCPLNPHPEPYMALHDQARAGPSPKPLNS